MAWMSADEAMKRLNIRQQTLYAYVSRGRVEARPDPADPRRSLYSAEDISNLAARRARPRKAAEVAKEAISWGEPVMASALTTVTRGRLYYRGRDAINLSQTMTLEDAAAFFWDAPYTAPKTLIALPSGTLKARLFDALAQRAGSVAATRGRARPVLAEECAYVLESLAVAAANGEGVGPIHQRLAMSWGLDGRGADLVRRALILLMDHELNPSTFAARVAASTGASLSACALAGLATLSGPLHGAQVHSVIKFLREGVRLGPHAAVRARLDEGRQLPGFGHNLYPEGDPRAAALLEAMKAPGPVREVCAAAMDETGLAPNVDLAVAALAVTLDIPEEAPFAIFAVGRGVGWLGHAMEQIETGAIIRPRARYIGPAPAPPLS
ncbi:MAG TPA: citrate synthase [Caulobacterales bacterium]|nr:citrate synthase [Caulobacterales bacterium]